jgi:hypothetical protein
MKDIWFCCIHGRFMFLSSIVYIAQGVHCSSTVNIHVRAQKGYYLEQACTKCTYKSHIVVKQEVDIHEAGDKAIEKYM